ncbi:hypothetical protein DQ04_05101010 [Trypanosoma grayi]|uniref:hypothetical protein n=1 Tax=Trypanosoma grayi TaxID=71804 RepID=UPI0004F46557|nr:hypothetical protein DQ04_05101010 [Trypanosoma grayi]KEG09509.1 hypothetical protein DQ04_05101010 [Trypanosoma grayi]
MASPLSAPQTTTRTPRPRIGSGKAHNAHANLCKVGQSLSIMRWVCEFVAARGLDAQGEAVPLFIVSLQLAKGSGIQYTRPFARRLAARRTPAKRCPPDSKSPRPVIP